MNRRAFLRVLGLAPAAPVAASAAWPPPAAHAHDIASATPYRPGVPVPRPCATRAEPIHRVEVQMHQHDIFELAPPPTHREVSAG